MHWWNLKQEMLAAATRWSALGKKLSGLTKLRFCSLVKNGKSAFVCETFENPIE